MSIVSYCRRPACTVSPDDTLRDAVQRMEKEGVGFLVVARGSSPVGVLTDRDVTLHVAARGHAAGSTPVAEAMSRPALAVAEEASLEEAMAVLREGHVRRLVVVDAEERLAGVISVDDLVLLLAREIGGLGEVLVAQLPAGASRPVGREAPGRAGRRSEHYQGPVVTVSADGSVAALAREMERGAVGSVVVVDEGGRAVGLVTDRDVALRAVAKELDPAATVASSIMSAPLVSADPTEPLEEVVGRMRTAGVRRIPVLRDGRPVGLVAFDDLLVALGRELDRLGGCVAGEIRAARLRSLSSRVRRELEDRLEDAASQLRRIGDHTLRGLGRELEEVLERVTGAGRRSEARRGGGGLRVADLMQTDVRRCTSQDALQEAARIMWERDCGCVPVVAADGSGRLVGMITDRDLCMAAYTRGARLTELQVGEVMSTQLHTCRPEDDLAEAEARMRAAQVRRLPVVDGAGHLRGILSLADLAEAAAGAHGVRPGAVSASEVGVVLESICRPRSQVTVREEPTV